LWSFGWVGELKRVGVVRGGWGCWVGLVVWVCRGVGMFGLLGLGIGAKFPFGVGLGGWLG